MGSPLRITKSTNNTGEAEALPKNNPIIFKNTSKLQIQSSDITICLKEGDMTQPANKPVQGARKLGYTNSMCWDDRMSSNPHRGPAGIHSRE